MSDDATLNMPFNELFPVPTTGGNIQQDDIKQGDDTQVIGDTPVVPDDKDTSVNLQDVLEASIDDTDTTDDTTKQVDDETKETEDTKGESSSSSATHTDGNPSESFALVFAKYLAEEEKLTEFDEEEFNKLTEGKTEAEAMGTLFENEVEINKKEIKSQYDDYNQEYISLRENGVAPEQATSLISEKETLDSITEDQITEDAELRKDILTHNFKISTKFSDDKIKKLVTQIIDIGEDVADAKEALDTLKTYNNDQIETSRKEEITRKQEAEDNYKKYVTSLNDTIESYKEIIPGQAINRTTKTKLNEMTTKPVKQNAQGQNLNAVWAKREENQVKFDTTLAYLIMNGVFDGKWDKITTKQKTKATQELKAKIDTSDKKSFTGGKTKFTQASKNNAESSLADMKRVFKL